MLEKQSFKFPIVNPDYLRVREARNYYYANFTDAEREIIRRVAREVCELWSVPVTQIGKPNTHYVVDPAFGDDISTFVNIKMT